MQFQMGVTSNTSNPPATLQPPLPDSVPLLLREILEIQKEHLAHARTISQDSVTRWRNLLARWQQDHPEFADQCKKAYPVMERTYVQLLVNMVEELARAEDDLLDSEFAVQEFLDRYGMRIGQLTHLLSIVGPLAEAAHQIEPNQPS